MKKGNINKDDNFKVNIVNLSLIANKPFIKLTDNNKTNNKINIKDDFNDTFSKRSLPLSERNYLFNIKEKELLGINKKSNSKKQNLKKSIYKTNNKNL